MPPTDNSLLSPKLKFNLNYVTEVYHYKKAPYIVWVGAGMSIPKMSTPIMSIPKMSIPIMSTVPKCLLP